MNPITNVSSQDLQSHVSLHIFCLKFLVLTIATKMKLFHNRGRVPKEVLILDLFDLLHINNILCIRPSSTTITQVLSKRILNLCVTKASVEVYSHFRMDFSV